MASTLFQALLATVVVNLVHQTILLLINLKKCRSHSIPAIVLPFDPLSILGTILNDPLHLLLRRLPCSLQPACTPYLRRGWFFHDKYTTWQKLGPIWALVSSKGIHVHIADPTAGLEILERRDRASNGDGFVRPAENYQLLAAFGPCLSTADNVNWPRHRKVLASPFNESIMLETWAESLRQATNLVEAWNSISEVPCVASDLRTLSLNVLAGAGFRRPAAFKSKLESIKTGEEQPMGYRNALQVVLDNIILIMLVPRRWFSKLAWSNKWQYVGRAAQAFEQHMVQMLDEEEQLMQQGSQGTGGIMTALVRALNTKANEQPSKTPKGLSREEVYGNIFVVNFAGHDTTANTLAFAVLLLTAHPEIQDWVAEEVRSHTRGTDPSSWGYGDVFSKLQRCRAIMFETLRLFPPICLLPKRTTTQAQSVKLGLQHDGGGRGGGGRQISIPPNSIVNIGILAVQTMPELWGRDALQWKPRRWIKTVEPGKGSGETFVEPQPPGSFLPWSGGPQNCPGAKFSEVEFVAVVATILCGHRLHAVPLPHESGAEDTRRRVMGVINDVDMQMLAKLRNGDAVKVRLRKRKT